MVPRCGEQGVERSHDVHVVADAALDGTNLIATLHPDADLVRSLGITSCVPQRQRVALARLLQSLAGVLTDRLQHPKPFILAINLHERVVDEQLDVVEDALSRISADCLQVRDRAPAGEHGHAPEQTLLGLAQQ